MHDDRNGRPQFRRQRQRERQHNEGIARASTEHQRPLRARVEQELASKPAGEEGHGGPDQSGAEPGADPAGQRAGGGAVVLFGGGGAGFLLQGGREQPGGLVAEEDLQEGEVTAGGLVPDHADRQGHRPKGGEPVEGAPALGGAAVAVGRQPTILEGGACLDIELASGRAGGFQNGHFEVIDRVKVTGYCGGGTHGDGVSDRPRTRLIHT